MAKLQRVYDVSPHTEEWAVDGVLSGLSMLWGAPGCGKSFVAISIACCVATGRPWLGRAVREGRVVYIAGEGGAESVARRLRAYLRSQLHIDILDPNETEYVPIDIVTPGVDLTKGPAEVMALLTGDSPVLIVVDTLSRCFTGDENKQEFMAGFVRSLDMLRDVYPHATVLVIHHSNKQDEVRGSSVLTGAVDTSWRMDAEQCPMTNTKTNGRILTAQKLRERDPDAVVRCQVERVVCRDADGQPELDQLGDEQTTLVVVSHANDATRRDVILSAGKALLGTKTAITYREWRDAVPHLLKADFDAGLSYILTAPGTYGILMEEKGQFFLDNGHTVKVS